MKIVDKAVKKVYRFNCPNCQSRLEGESNYSNAIKVLNELKKTRIFTYKILENF